MDELEEADIIAFMAHTGQQWSKDNLATAPIMETHTNKTDPAVTSMC